MPKTKVALTIDSELLERVDELVERRRFRNRSQAIEAALADKLERLARTRPRATCRIPADSGKQGRGIDQALVDQDQPDSSLSVDRLGARIGRASEEELARVLDGLNEILG